MKVVITKEYQPLEQQIQQIIETFDTEGDLLYDGTRNSVKLFYLDNKAVVIKGFKKPNIVNKFVYRFFRPSKAARSYYYAQKLTSFGIGTPKAVAYIENSSFLCFKDSYYISEFLDATLTYRELITQPDYPDKEIILKQFTAFTKKLHDHGVLFKDHSPGNTLIEKVAPATYAFYLVDLNRMTFKDLTYRERIANFARLTPQKEMVRSMAYAYAELGGYDKEEVFRLMWEETDKFHTKFQRKRRIKRRVFFWKDKYK